MHAICQYEIINGNKVNINRQNIAFKCLNCKDQTHGYKVLHNIRSLQVA